MYWNILGKQRKQILPHLAFVRKYGFYLAGGTALALQLGHRHSIDFDFYTSDAFDEMAFERDAVANLDKFKVTQRNSGKLIGQIGAVDVNFYYYPYSMIESVIVTEHIDVCSIPDIAAMKLIAVSQRGIRRDFLDLYVISRNYELAQMIEWAQNKYSQFDIHECLKSLTYFKDAEKDESGRGMEINEPIIWSKIKYFFASQAVELANKWL
jgi:predicted nucleotidyltransferase component of viral defense system